MTHSEGQAEAPTTGDRPAPGSEQRAPDSEQRAPDSGQPPPDGGRSQAGGDLPEVRDGEPSARSDSPNGRRAYGPRERMVFSAAQLIRHDGVMATGMREVAAHAQAPRGSLQHYFPGGKEQLVNEAVAWAGRYAGRRVTRFVAAMEQPTPSGLFTAMVQQWIDEYEQSGFGAGCPVAAATVDCAESAPATRTATAAAFATWSEPVAAALTGMGVPAAEAPALATVMISALEGAILFARAEQDVRALRTVAREIGPMLDARVVR